MTKATVKGAVPTSVPDISGYSYRCVHGRYWCGSLDQRNAGRLFTV